MGVDRFTATGVVMILVLGHFCVNMVSVLVFGFDRGLYPLAMFVCQDDDCDVIKNNYIIKSDWIDGGLE